MYLCHLFVVMIGMSKTALDAMGNLSLPDDCRLRTESAATLQEAAALANPGCSAIVLGEHIAWNIGEINELFGTETSLVLCGADASVLSAEQLSRVAQLWPALADERMGMFYVQRLVEDLYRQKSLWNMQNCLQTVIDTMPGFVWFKDMEGHHLKVNQAFCEMVGKSMDEVVGRQHCEIWGITPEQYAEGEYVCLETDSAIAEKQQTTLFKEQVLHSRLGMRQLETYKTPVFDENGKMIGNIGMATDVTEECANKERILQLSRTDELTRLANRRYFYQYVDRNRQGALTLCYIDLDYFKQLNDTYGHQFGDAALMLVAEVLQNAFPHDFIARLGGDEFIVAMFSAPGREQMGRLLDNLIQSAQASFRLDKSFCNLSMSIGVASAADGSVTLDTLLQRSDDALYYVKEHCRGRYVFYEDIRDKLIPRQKNDK